VAALREAPRADLIALPRASLDYAGQRFLDDGTPAEIEEAAGTPILFAHNLSEVLRHLSSPLK
jgi:NifB/MoaA-like Fe-S oxidoreductase